MVQNWTSYREFWFDPNTTSIHNADRYQLEEIAQYMRSNPSLELGIDASSNPRASSRRDTNEQNDRVQDVRESLIAAGVPEGRISDGMFGDSQLRRDGRVEILLRTDRRFQGQSASASAQGGSSQLFGAQAPRNVGEDWTTYQSFFFDSNTATIHQSDRNRLREMGEYLRQNQSMQIGIDNSASQNDSGYRDSDSDLIDRRADAVRRALIAGGAPESNIQIGSFSDSREQREGRVEVLIRNTQRERSNR